MRKDGVIKMTPIARDTLQQMGVIDMKLKNRGNSHYSSIAPLSQSSHLISYLRVFLGHESHKHHQALNPVHRPGTIFRHSQIP